MNRSLAEMFEYNRWALATLVEACRELTDEQLDASVAGVSDSVRHLLMHVVGGQQTFALRPKGRQHEGELNRRAPWPGFEELARLAEESSAQLIEIAAHLNDDATAVLTYMGTKTRWPVRFFLVHAIEHGIEHRTEIKVALNSLGVTTPDLDGWNFAAAMGYGETV